MGLMLMEDKMEFTWRTEKLICYFCTYPYACPNVFSTILFIQSYYNSSFFSALCFLFSGKILEKQDSDLS